MATHYVEPGTVPIILGAIYSTYPANSSYSAYWQYRATLINEATMTVKLTNTVSKYVTYVSFAVLSSRWHLIRRK